MAVPNTTTFTLDDVLSELGLGDGDSLQDCFDDATSGSFDATYNPNSDGTDNNLLNFRNYGGASYTLNIVTVGNPGTARFVVEGSTASQSVQLQFRYSSQINVQGTTVSVYRNGTTLMSVGDTFTINTGSGGAFDFWNLNPFDGTPFTIGTNGSDYYNIVTVSMRITSASVDSFNPAWEDLSKTYTDQ